MAMNSNRQASAGMASRALALFALLFVVSGLTLALGAHDDDMILIDASTADRPDLAGNFAL